MSYRIWYSTQTWADFIKDNTILNEKDVDFSQLPPSDTKPDFHKFPDHLKSILYLDSPDIIVEFDNEPIFTIEESSEAGTGHSAFQRFSRLVASVENNVPALYLYPQAKIIGRRSAKPRWD